MLLPDTTIFSQEDFSLGCETFGRNSTFVTSNRHDFGRVTGLKVDNWFE